MKWRELRGGGRQPRRTSIAATEAAGCAGGAGCGGGGGGGGGCSVGGELSSRRSIGVRGRGRREHGAACVVRHAMTARPRRPARPGLPSRLLGTAAAAANEGWR